MISNSFKVKCHHFVDFICFLYHSAVIVLGIWTIIEYKDDAFHFQVVLAALLLAISYFKAADQFFFWCFVRWGYVCFVNTWGACFSYHFSKWCIHVAFIWGLVDSIVYSDIYYVSGAFERHTLDWLIFLAIAIYWFMCEFLYWKVMDIKVVLKYILHVEKPEAGLSIATWNLQRGNSLAKEPSFDKQFALIKNKKLDIVLFQDADYLDYFPLISDGFCLTPEADESRHIVTLAKGDILENKKLQFKNQKDNEEKCAISSFIKLFNGKYVWACNVWLTQSKSQKTQTLQVLELIEQLDEFCDDNCNIAIGGTFNMEPTMHAMRYLSYIICDSWKWGALEVCGGTGYYGDHVFPVYPYYARTDYLFAQGEKFELLESSTGGAELSSHKLVCASFETLSNNALDTENAGKSHMPLNTTENNQGNDSSIA